MQNAKIITTMDTTKANSQNGNYSYVHPTQTQPQTQQVVYLQKKRDKNWFLYLLGCGGCFLLLLCTCILPVVFLSAVSSGSGEAFTLNSRSNNVEQVTIAEYGDRSASQSTKIAVINVTGEIVYSMPNELLSSDSTSYNIITQLQKAKDDTSVGAVLLRWNSPGGYATAAEPICRSIKEVRAKKPVYSFIDSQGASLAYLLPNCTEYIYARSSAITGSIGVIIQAIDFYGVLEKLGGKVVFVTNTEGDQKSGEDIFQPGSETYKIYQGLLDEQYEYFVNKVYEGRKANKPEITLDQIKRISDGRIFSGTQAKQLGLVDETGEFEDALAGIIKKENLSNKKIDVVEYSILTNPFADLFGGIRASLKNTDVKNQVRSELSVLMKAGVVPQTTAGE